MYQYDYYATTELQPSNRRRRRPPKQKRLGPLQDISLADLTALETQGDVEVFASHNSHGLLDHVYRSGWRHDPRYLNDSEPLFYRFQRSLIVVRPEFERDQKNFPLLSCDDPELPTVDDDFLVHFRRAVSSEPLVFDNYGDVNHWDSDDFLFHLPFYYSEHGLVSIKDDTKQSQPKSEISTRPAANPCGDRRLTMESKLRRVQFVREAVATAVFLDPEQRYRKNRVPKRPIQTYKWDEWVTLVVAPKTVLSREKIEQLLEGSDEALPKFFVWKRNEEAKEPWRRFDNAYYFQMHLIVVMFVVLVEKWKENMEYVNCICDDIENELDGNLLNYAYFQKESVETLTRIYRASKNIEVLEKSLFYIVDRKDGIWHKFRFGKQRGIMWDWEKRSEYLRKERRDTSLEDYQIRMWKDLLWTFADKQMNSFNRISVRLTERREKLESLRQLLVDLSQTRASLYANRLGEHVNYLTYVSIIFLPLGFCTSLWSMNYDLHSKTAFVVTMSITSVVTLFLIGGLFLGLNYRLGRSSPSSSL
ncbi:hypothetical protein HDK77DRAFT_436252 [Phyllosticta capitalensis]